MLRGQILKSFGFLITWTDCKASALLGKLSCPTEFEMRNNYLNTFTFVEEKYVLFHKSHLKIQS